MIPIVSKGQIEKNSFPSPPTPLLKSPPLQTASSLCSLKQTHFISKIGQKFVAVIKLLLVFIKKICCCEFYRNTDHSSPVNTENISKIESGTLLSDDPFLNKIFVIDEEGNQTLKEKRGFELITNLFQILAAGGAWHWYKNLTQIQELQKELEQIKFDPFESLYLLVPNKTMTQLVLKFRHHVFNDTALETLLSLIGKNNPWEEFLIKKSVHFSKKCDPALIPGFCKALNLNQEDVSSFCKEQKWRELILYVIEERKKYFEL